MNKLNEEISRIRQIINESDIGGIDELVYNPLTGPTGEIGYGYDRGEKRMGITWPNHEDHLHVGFTNKEVAIAVIDKAIELGLTATENPYAKTDPTGKVEKVHVRGSLHYETFVGEPKVGRAVDISGDKQKIKDLILWIEQNYANKTIQDSPSEPAGVITQISQTAEDAYKDIINYEIGGKKVKDILNITQETLGAIAKVDFWEVLKAFGAAFKGIRRIPDEELYK